MKFTSSRDISKDVNLLRVEVDASEYDPCIPIVEANGELSKTRFTTNHIGISVIIPSWSSQEDRAKNEAIVGCESWQRPRYIMPDLVYLRSEIPSGVSLVDVKSPECSLKDHVANFLSKAKDCYGAGAALHVVHLILKQARGIRAHSLGAVGQGSLFKRPQIEPHHIRIALPLTLSAR